MADDNNDVQEAFDAWVETEEQLADIDRHQGWADTASGVIEVVAQVIRHQG